MDNLLSLLRDDNEYYRGVGRNYLSNSDIGVLLTNPRDFGKVREDNKSFAEGRYFHQLILEPEKAVNTKFVDVASRNTKEYRNYCEDNNIEFCLLKKEILDIEHLVSVMKGNITFYDEIYKDGNEFEVPAFADIQGTMWKGKADIVGTEMLIDLKTTSDINKFKYSAKSYNYDSQCYIYQQLFGKPLVFFVIDKITSQLGIFKPSDDFIHGGEHKVTKALKVYRKYFGQEPTDSIENYFVFDTL